ncbi:MAG: 3-hydroxyacyl-CoA dehydrogenase/enoyl-CoA hydratase/3-hydroxybutyryl-CoA epimerase [Cellvibrionaceae bacterium]|jgi:3-hydroxyacyl-CoA dehydrogenase/enoyl-CoA hydratase/3-hydroxybutyryl-CoA epimerase/enoyl-CoA isomerase
MLYQGKNLSVTLHSNDCAEHFFAELCFDAADSSVNIFNSQTVKELSAALDSLESKQASDVKGLLITSAKEGFIAGADISEFAPRFSEGESGIVDILDSSNINFNRIEDLPFPVVVAVNGFALGGGCELCLACDYRIGSTAARIGLPETRLGIIPGWGGTVRLPRIAGIETAIEWIAGGHENKAEVALKAGVFDGVVSEEKLKQAAFNTLERCADGSLDYFGRRQQKQTPLHHKPTELMMAITTSKAFVASQAGPHYPAPIAAVDVIAKAASCHREAALKIESQAFIKVAQTTVALALSGLFLNDQFIAKKAKKIAKTADKKVERAAVLGAGIMGGGIAYQSAYKNVPIKMKDIAQAGIDLGLSEANKLLNKGVERGRMSPLKMGEVLNNIEPTLSYDGFTDIDIVVEAVVENPKVKQSVLAEVEQHISDDTIIATNTSTISVDLLATALKRPENFCGMHFFNPVHAMPLVEVIRGKVSSESAIARTVAYANTMGKKAIVVGDCPGFLVNRVLFPYFAGFAMLLRDGADFQKVDKVMEQWGWPMGPAYLLDVVGIDTGVHAEKVMAEGFPTRMGRDFTSATDILYKVDRYGQKNSKGFYDYAPDKKGRPGKVVTELTYELLKPHVASANDFSDDEIIARMMIPMATELARCLEEGIVASPAEADMALIYGLGFPPFKGGIFRWLDSIGLKTFCDMAKKYEPLGELYHVTSCMQHHADNNTIYYPLTAAKGGE